MQNLYKTLLQRRGQPFQQQRGGKELGQVIGVPNHETLTNRQYISLYTHTDVQEGDCLLDEQGQAYYISEAALDYFDGEPTQLKGYYTNQPVTQQQTAEATEERASKSIADLRAKVFCSNAPDKEDLMQVVNLLEMVVSNQTIAREGLLFVYAPILERNPWLAESVANILYQWFVQSNKLFE